MRYERSGSTVCPLNTPSKRPSSGRGNHDGQYTGALILFASCCQPAFHSFGQVGGAASTGDAVVLEVPPLHPAASKSTPAAAPTPPISSTFLTYGLPRLPWLHAAVAGAPQGTRMTSGNCCHLVQPGSPSSEESRACAGRRTIGRHPARGWRPCPRRAYRSRTCRRESSPWMRFRLLRSSASCLHGSAELRSDPSRAR